MELIEKNKSNKNIVFWLDSCIFLICLLIVVGGITRLTNSGLSMVEWKPIIGIIPPINENQWNESFENYKAFPEYKNYHSDFLLSDYKKIFYWEYLHRMLGRLIGLYFLIPLLYFKAKKYLTKEQFKRLFSIFLLICIQGVFGWIMVQSGLVGIGAVSPYKLSIHLSLAMFIIGCIYWIKLDYKYNYKIDKHIKQKLINNILLILFMQIVLGAITAGFGIGKVFLTSKNIFYDIYSKLPFFIQTSHILLGIIFTLTVLFLSKRMLEKNDKAFKYTNALSYIVIFQFFTGIINIINAVPILIALLHQFIVIVILFLSIKIKYLLSVKE